MASNRTQYMRIYMRELRSRWVRAGLTTHGKERSPFGRGHCVRCGLVSPTRVCQICEVEVAA